MISQLHLANSLVESRARSARDGALVRTVELARREERRARRAARRAAR